MDATTPRVAARPTPVDRLVFLGDYVDRGPDTRGVLDRMIRIRQTFPHAVFLRGNHELMMTRSRNDKSERRMWFSVGGMQALASYGQAPGLSGRIEDVPAEHWEFLRGCWANHETSTHLFIHAGYVPDLPMEEQPGVALRWRVTDAHTATPHCSGKVAVVGHTPQKSGEVLDLGFLVCIDTNCCRGGWLTALDVDGGQTWQADRRGRLRGP